ncbi:MAG: hypothetical protein FWF98_03445 [Dehalococcoidia bacterium]|nr:hypothetical protein [Dehalococcoidia bacterium]
MDLPQEKFYCYNCGALNSRSSNFCIQCGARVAASSVASRETIAPTAYTPSLQPEPVVLRHSKIGIVSCVIACVSFINIIITTGGCMDNCNDVGYNPDAFKVLSAISMIGVVILVIGITTGIIGIVQPNRKKLFAILGLIFNTIMLVPAPIVVLFFLSATS